MTSRMRTRCADVYFVTATIYLLSERTERPAW